MKGMVMMRIRCLKIDGLFNAYNYKMTFNDKSRITIITGPNGYGKTTILKILYSLSKMDLLFFLKLTFNEIIIEFENGEKLRINRQKLDLDDTDDETSNINVDFCLFSTENKEISRLDISDRDVEWVRKTNAGGFVIEGDTLYYNESSKKKIGDNSEIVKLIAKKNKNEQFLLYLSELKCSFISYDRIYTGIKEKKEIKESIELVAESFRTLINDSREKYYSNAQTISETMVSQILDDTIKPLNEEAYNQLADSIMAQIRQLKRFNIIDDVSIRPYNAKMDKVLTVDLLATKEKIKVCNDMLIKMQRFHGLLTKKHLANKYIIYDRRVGFMIKDSATGDSISLRELSSGEKNEIIILFKTIFQTGNGTVLLLDEPENSLHVAWQVGFIDDIEAISEANDLQVIIATHSPSIIGDRWNMTFDLYERNET